MSQNKQIKAEIEQAMPVESSVQSRQISFEKIVSIVVAISLLFNVFLYSQVQNLTGQNTVLISTIDKLSSSKPAVLQTGTTIPVGSPVAITIINDQRCVVCDVTGLVTKLKEVFPTAVFNNVDYSSAKQLVASSNVTLLPAILFDQSVLQSAGYAQVSSYLEPAGDYLSLKVGSVYDPVCEGDGRCDLPKCQNTPVCRTKIPDKLDLFIMSKCPYGMQALDSMKEVLNAVKGIDFNVHYIAGLNPQTGLMESLHGQAEVDEDMRELCAAKYYPDKYLNYIWCRNTNITSDAWQMCALKTGFDVSKIGTCASGSEGKDLLIADVKIGQDLNIGASPTWFANNYKTFSALSAQDIKTNICGLNPDLVGCGTQLSSNTTVAAGACATP